MADSIANQWSISLRPKSFKEYFGNDRLKKYFYSSAKNKSWPTATLLQGQFGGGKTTAAQIIAQMMVCQNPDEEGNPCCECASCKAIIEEKFNRDVMQIDGGQASKDTIIETIPNFVSTPPWKDSHKIIILEEVQELSQKAKNSLLKLIETRRSHVHYIFTSMEDMKASGLTSRCVSFKFQRADIPSIMYYLKSVMEKTGMWTDETIPQDFKLQGLQLIAANSEGSYRQATQILEQCYKTKVYDLETVQKEFGLVNIADFQELLLAVLNGDVSEKVYNALVNSENYNQTFNLIMKVISDAECFRLFGDVSGKDRDNDWWHQKLVQQASQLANHKNYKIMRDGFEKMQQDNSAYLKLSTYLIGVCKIVDACKSNLTAAPVGGRRIIN